MDALPPARRDGRAPPVSRRRLLWAGSARVAAIRERVFETCTESADCAISKPWPAGVL